MSNKQIEALKLALEALEIGHEYAVETAEHFHIEMAGYKQHRHDAMDAEVKQISDAITAIREALAEQTAPPPECQTEAEKTALDKMAENARALGLDYEPAQQQEPVAWMIWTHGPVNVFMNKDEANMEFDRLNHAYPEPTRMLAPLYTSPQPAQPSKPWVGLTDEEVDECYYWKGRQWTTDELVRHVEAKLREKNNG